MAKDIYTKIDELVTELGTAESHRQELVQEISDLESELEALDKLADEATSRSEYDAITAQRKEAELDIRFSRNRLRLFDQSPRIDPETLTDLLNQLSAEIDAAAKRYRQKVEKPVAEIVKAGDEFDATANMVREAVRKLASVTGPASERGNIWQMFYPFELGTLRSRAYTDGTTVRPSFRDALRLASTAKQEPFDAR